MKTRKTGIKGQARQGDILYELVDDKPSTHNMRVKQDGVVANGEATGHAHALREPGVESLLWQTLENTVSHIETRKRTEITHPEHVPPIQLKARKIYKITRQREYEPDGWKTVID